VRNSLSRLPTRRHYGIPPLPRSYDAPAEPPNDAGSIPLHVGVATKRYGSQLPEAMGSTGSAGNLRRTAHGPHLPSRTYESYQAVGWSCRSCAGTSVDGVGVPANQASVHRLNHPADQIQLCTLLNIKTGGCGEDCSYCAQSSRHDTGLKAEKLSEVEPVLVYVQLSR
jgi:hypothetical protein